MEGFKGQEIFIQKSTDNQVVTEIKELYIDLYDGIIEKVRETFPENNLEPEDFIKLAARNEYALNGLRLLRESFLHIETALDA